ncbi:SymE family type I addiction module toxin [Chitinophaga fulva]|nr:SymE family type I addiction module toxin [Chitinophaga fulva]
MKRKTIRRGKVHSRCQEVVKLYSDGRSGYRGVPLLRIGGLWMERVGFMIGDAIDITVKAEKLIITKASANENR